MKTIKKLLLAVLVMVFITPTVSVGQNEGNEDALKPVYLSITTMKKCKDSEMNLSEWMDLEKEYYEKITLKNDLIIGSGVYYQYVSPNDSQIKIVNIYNSWEDIEEATKKTDELVIEGWPEEDIRREFFKKQKSYYICDQSNEIYMTTPYESEIVLDSNKPQVFYLKDRKKGDGSDDFEKYYNQVTKRNVHVKGFYSHVNKWGESSSRDAMEVFVYDNFKNVDPSFEENHKLISEHWPPNKKEANAMFKEYTELFSGKGNFVYTNVPGLSK